MENEINYELIMRVVGEMERRYDITIQTPSYKKVKAIQVGSLTFFRWIQDLKIACASKTLKNIGKIPFPLSKVD